MFMQDIEANADRARKNRLLATGLFAVSLGILGAMAALVFLTRTGILARLLSHLGRLY
jgi:hypothetical protein